MNHTWGEVAHELKSLGSSRWRDVIAEAKGGGCDPDMAYGLIQWGKCNGHNLGTIQSRLSKARPTLAIDFGWPDKLPPITPPPARQSPSRAEARQESEYRRWEIIHFGRKAGKSPAEIAAELQAEGLEV